VTPDSNHSIPSTNFSRSLSRRVLFTMSYIASADSSFVALTSLSQTHSTVGKMGGVKHS